jgi:hypothetical protein
MPDLYEKFMVETQGVRRFLLKWGDYVRIS